MSAVRAVRTAPSWLPLAAALAGGLFTAAAFWPGFMSYDSIVQLIEARSGVYSDWHPPIMAFLWRQIDRVVPGPQGFLLLDTAMIWGSFAILSRGTASPGWTSLLVLASGLCPPVFALAGTIWKDVTLAGAFLLATALLVHSWKTGRSRSAILATAPLFLGATLRHNGFVAAIPLSVWTGMLIRRQQLPAVSPLVGPALGSALLLVVVGGGALATSLLTGGRSAFPAQQIFLHDLAGLSAKTGVNVLPEAFRGTATVEGLRAQWNPADDVSSLVGVAFSSDAVRMKELRQTWLTQIRNHFQLWLHHRLQMTAAVLGLNGVHYPFQRGIDENPWGYEFARGARQRLTLRWLECTGDTFLFRPAVWLAAAVAALALGMRRRDLVPEPGRVLCASAILYLVPLPLVAPVADFRMSFWTVLATVSLPLVLMSCAGSPPTRPTEGTAAR
jgi:hypothetical protein